MNYMRYETGAAKALRPLSVKRSTNITKLTSGQIVWHLYKRHEIIVLHVALATILAWAVVTKLG